MFFILSKVLWVFAAPSNVFFFLTALGTVAAFFARGRGRRLAQAAALAGVLGLAVIGYSPLGSAVVRSLEDRFPEPDLAKVEPAGIIVLGGAIDSEMGQARHQIHLADNADRIPAAVLLAHRFPHAKLIFTGGSPALFGESRGSEADDTRRLWLGLGVPADQITIEDKSRNTYENAVFTRDLIHPAADQAYILLTSAYHMPRSVGLFRKAGFHVIPYPVDYRTLGDDRDWKPRLEIGEGLHLVNMGVREWIGLVAYRLTGRTASLFPGP